jgi:hypothetical protein
MCLAGGSGCGPALVIEALSGHDPVGAAVRPLPGSGSKDGFIG